MSIHTDEAVAENGQRSEWAFTALLAYAEKVGHTTSRDWTERPDETVSMVARDLLGDIFHMARRLDIAPDELVGPALARFHEEVAQEQEWVSDLQPAGGHPSEAPAPNRVRLALAWVTRLLGGASRGHAA